jgi:rhodanese-related sulfurtransferase
MTIERVSSAEARRRSDEDGWTLLDVRSMPEYAEQHAEGALNVPFLHKTPNGMIPNQDFARVIAFQFPDKSAKIITQDMNGGRSKRAAQELESFGYEAVVDMMGGLHGESEGDGELVDKRLAAQRLPVGSGEPEGRSYKSIALRMNAAESGEEVPAPEAASTPRTPGTA